MDDPTFIKIWQTSKSTEEICSRIEAITNEVLPSYRYALRASDLRKKGVPLKYYRHGRPRGSANKKIDAEYIAQLCELASLYMD